MVILNKLVVVFQFYLLRILLPVANLYNLSQRKRNASSRNFSFSNISMHWIEKAVAVTNWLRDTQQSEFSGILKD